MPRFIVERIFPDGFDVPATEVGRSIITEVGANNARSGVHWITTFVAADRSRTFCVYDSPDRDSLRRAASLSELPVDNITEVNVLDPAFYLDVDQAPDR